jgi:hypothetical protein
MKYERKDMIRFVLRKLYILYYVILYIVLYYIHRVFYLVHLFVVIKTSLTCLRTQITEKKYFFVSDISFVT